jgi:hypothetical protein
LNESLNRLITGLGQEISSANPNGSNGGVEPISFGLTLHGRARNLAHGPLDEFEAKIRRLPCSSHSVPDDSKLAVRPQRDAGIVTKHEERHRVWSSDEPITLKQGLAHINALGC